MWSLFLFVIFLSSRSATLGAISLVPSAPHHDKEYTMISWRMWEGWMNRVWGNATSIPSSEADYEVAHEPSRLPVELQLQGKVD
ncbi:MAG: hypothetical protein ACRC6D_10255 [Aeromonas sp.]